MREERPMPSAVIWNGIFAFLAVFAGIAVSGYVLFVRGLGRRGAASRLRELAESPSPPTAPATGGLVPAVLELLARVGSVRAAPAAELRRKCLNAGFFHAKAPTIFVGTQVLLVLVLAGAGALAALWTVPGAPKGAALTTAPPWGRAGLFAATGAGLGLVLPSSWLSAQVRRRQRRLLNAFPDVLDMLVLCLEGGVTINAAIQQVNEELQTVHPVLALEMNIVEREIQLGLSPAAALRRFGDRCGLSDVRDLGTVLLQSERYGASITKTLRNFVEAARLDRQQKAEEMAQKAAVKILFPTMLCIFPAIFIVVLGPAAFQLSVLFNR
jgi:tight adherence protein C